MGADRDAPDVEGHTFLGVEDQVRFLIDWQHEAAPAVARLIRDQDYRDHRLAERARTWKVWSIRLSVAVAAIAVAGSLFRTLASGLRVLGLP